MNGKEDKIDKHLEKLKEEGLARVKRVEEGREHARKLLKDLKKRMPFLWRDDE